MKRTSLSLLLALCFLLLGSCASAGGGGAAPVPAPDTPAPEGPEPTPAIPAPTPVLDTAERRLASMTREEKLCQMLLLCSSDDEELLSAAEHGVGGLCLYTASFAGKDRDEVAAMTADLQARSPIPLLSDTEEKAQLLLSLGLNVNLAPVADIPKTNANFIFPRCVSIYPEETAEYVERVVRVMKREGIGSAVKHFPGYGGSADTHTGQAFDERPYEAFTEGDFLPFIAGIEAGADAVLVSHNIVLCMDPERPASLSPEVHRILREDLGFEGVILCDDLSMEAIGQFAASEHPAVLAAQAGNDLLCCGDREGALEAMLGALEDGRLSEEQVDRSVLRVLRWKLALGLAV